MIEWWTTGLTGVTWSDGAAVWEETASWVQLKYLVTGWRQEGVRGV